MVEQNGTPEFQFLDIEIKNKIAHAKLNRPEKANSLHLSLWQEFKQAFQWLAANPQVRVVVLSANGKNFCAGIDLEMFNTVTGSGTTDIAVKSERVRQSILELQESFNAMEACLKPVICAIQGACVGGGVDLIAAADMRYACEGAWFSVKEVDLAMAADVGTLQRLPQWIGGSAMRELCFTGRRFDAQEALQLGLLNKLYDSQEQMMESVMEVAAQIAEKSPVAIRAIKDNILFSRDHTVSEGLRYVATWNASQLMTKDLQEAVRAKAENRPPVFEDS